MSPLPGSTGCLLWGARVHMGPVASGARMAEINQGAE